MPGFKFRPVMHEPGDEGAARAGAFPRARRAGGEALAFLADHPATYRHLATKLVRHFVADAPPPDAVRRVEGVLRDTGGDLGAASLAIIAAAGGVDAAGQAADAAGAGAGGAARRRRCRRSGGRRSTGSSAGWASGMFSAPFPIGWPDTAADWAGPEAMLRRIDWAYGFAARPELPEPAALADTVLGPLLSPATAAAMRRRRVAAGRDHLVARFTRIPEALIMMHSFSPAAARCWGWARRSRWGGRRWRWRRRRRIGGSWWCCCAARWTGWRRWRRMAMRRSPGCAGLAPAPGRGGLLDLGGFYGLHPALAGMHGMYAAGELLPVHAVAGPVRTRSHFEAQDIMESGAEQRLTSGWLNRAVQGMAPAGPNGAPLSIGVALPLLLRGPAPVGAYAPQSFQQPQADLYARLIALHAHDPVTGPAIAEGLAGARVSPGAQLGGDARAGGERYAFPALAAAAGRLLAAADGPRIAAMELGGWDTHAAQAQRLVGPLRQLDAGLVALRDGAGRGVAARRRCWSSPSSGGRCM